MSGTMPVRSRNAAWEALKNAAQRVVDAERVHPFNAAELLKAKDRLAEVWQRFPECWDDHPSTIPPAISILASIKRQEEAERQAAAFAQQAKYLKQSP